MKKINSILLYVVTFLSVVLIVGVYFLFPACSGMGDGVKSCQLAERMVMVLGIGLLFTSILQFIYKERQVRAALSLISIVLASITLIIPKFIIPLCDMKDMHCNAVMRPAVLGLGILIVLLSFILFFLNSRGKSK